ncbi:aquaporin Z [Variovorax fucosicus]|uniref:aquaporin Z n=1 Tax=Variovorax fucosicus TaxID=3053517 RepID=UPI002578BB96|nr:aquaporin Z [Variovorax sp. J22G47]MDM0055387.1 aquaporin Z [Variovorax sp. J22G47]
MHKTNISIWSAEFLGTFWLTLGGCGSAVLAAAFPGLGIGLLGVSLAFGLTVVTGAYAFGSVSGAHFNPAVSFGLVVAGRMRASALPGYVISQVFGACAAAAVLYLIATGRPGADIGSFAVNGYGIHSPGQYGLVAALLCEVVMTAMFLIVILGATAKPAASGFAGLAIGLCLTLIHLVSIPVTNTSVNPARSIGPALFGPAWASSQLWLFVVAPLAGAAIGALVHRFLLKSSDEAEAG